MTKYYLKSVKPIAKLNYKHNKASLIDHSVASLII